MGLFDTLATVSNRKQARLHQSHPLAGVTLQLRYLGTVSLLTAIDREISEMETHAFMALGDSMGVD